MIVKPHIRVIIMIGITVIAITVLSIYNYLGLRSATDVEKVDNLSGQRIACCIGWESDYLLSPRKDITLLRYESNAECMLGLAYKQVDAVAVDEISCIDIFEKTEGLERLDGYIARVGLTYYASHAAEDILAEFNEYAAEFVKSDEYDDFHDGILEGNYSVFDCPELTEGKVLHIGYIQEGYPESYIDFTTNGPAGYGIDFLKRFAYDKGYQIEWTECSETSAAILVAQNKLDFAASYLSDVYREDTERNGYVHMTDAYCFVEVKLIKVQEGQEFKITGEIES